MTNYLLDLKFRLATVVLLLLALLLLLAGGPSRAQVPSAQGPFNVDLGAIITNTNAPAGLVNSANQNNLNVAGVTCTMVVTAMGGTPSVNFQIQGFDTGTGSWNNLVVSPAVTAQSLNQPVSLTIGRSGSVQNPVPSIGFSTPFTFPLAANSQSVALPLPRTWRVQELIGGSGPPTVTAKSGCVTEVF